MIGTMARIQWISLRRDKIAQALTFALPIGFFSLFAFIFGGLGMGKGSTPALRVAIVDEDNSEASRRFAGGLAKERSFRARTTFRASNDGPEIPLTRPKAEALVRAGELAVAIVIPPGWGAHFPSFDGAGPPVELLVDSANPVGAQMAAGLIQKAAMTGAPDLFMRGGLAQLEKYGGGLTDQQRRSVDAWLKLLNEPQGAAVAVNSSSATNEPAAGFGAGGLVATKTVDLLGEKKKNPATALYAAGIGVMFLLFSCSGAAGALLEEVETGTMERLLISQLGMGKLLLGKWLFIAIMGFAQLVLMFVWGALLFKVELVRHLGGFLVMTFFTSVSAAAFGLALAAACRSRAQLSGISTLVILGMSALGGSMIPRFLMSEGMQKAGLVTFNGWALDGYMKVFWREAPVSALWPEALVLAVLTGAFLLVARVLARRWETI